MSLRDELAEALARTQYEARKDATFNYIALVSPTWDEMWDTHRTKWTQQAEPMADAILPIIEREVEKARAESEAKARRFANLLGNQAKYLNDVLPAEALRQKADAWDEGSEHRATRPRHEHECHDCNPYKHALRAYGGEA